MEVLIENLTVINKADLTPFIIADKTDALEETRLQYRYLDIRRPILQNRLKTRAKIVRLFHEFFQALANTAGMTLHVVVLAGDENHHCLEAIFKAFGRAIRMAVAIDPAMADELPSTKGVLE